MEKEVEKNIQYACIESFENFYDAHIDIDKAISILKKYKKKGATIVQIYQYDEVYKINFLREETKEEKDKYERKIIEGLAIDRQKQLDNLLKPNKK